jgi:hypothetical protein
MKTYKLIKTYPGSFPLGHLAILDESVKYYNLGTTTRSLDYIENHPENWQHVCYKCHENVNTCKTFGCKQPLFITEDGVDIFAGDIFYSIRKDCLGRIVKYEGNFFEIASTKCKGFVDFSTKKAAENYIKMNKPCLSLNDVLSITNKTSFVPEDFSKNLIKKELTKIVKQKLK